MLGSHLPSVGGTYDILPGSVGLSTYLYVLKNFPNIGQFKRTYLRQGQFRCYD